MVAILRIGLALIVFGLLTPPMAAAQFIALKFDPLPEKFVPRWWHRLTLRCLGVRVHVTGAPSDQRPLLIASNHASWTDIMVIGAHADVRYIAKSDVARWPGWGTVARLNRTVFVDRERRGKTGEQASQVAERMASGDAMVLFPEGTTADNNFLLPFKTSLFGAAEMALEQSGVDTLYIQPVAVAYTRLNGVAMNRSERALTSWAGAEGLWPHVLRLLKARAVDAQLRFGQPIAYTAHSSRKAVARRVEAEVRSMFAGMVDKP